MTGGMKALIVTKFIWRVSLICHSHIFQTFLLFRKKVQSYGCRMPFVQNKKLQNVSWCFRLLLLMVGVSCKLFVMFLLLCVLLTFVQLHFSMLHCCHHYLTVGIVICLSKSQVLRITYIYVIGVNNFNWEE